MTKKIFALVMVVSVLGVFLAGCGSKDDSSGGTTGTTTAATAGTPPPATTAGTPPATTAGDTK